MLPPGSGNMTAGQRQHGRRAAADKTQRLSKADAWRFASIMGSIVFVGFLMPTLRRSQSKALRIEMPTKTEVKALVEQLLGQGRLAAKAVNGPTGGRSQVFVKSQNLVEGLHAMNGNGKLMFFGQLYLANKPLFLYGHFCAAQTVDATLAQGNNRRDSQNALQALKKGVYVFPVCPPRMNAGRIAFSLLKTKIPGRQQSLNGKIDDGLAGRGIEIVRVEIHKP